MILDFAGLYLFANTKKAKNESLHKNHYLKEFRCLDYGYV